MSQNDYVVWVVSFVWLSFFKNFFKDTFLRGPERRRCTLWTAPPTGWWGRRKRTPCWSRGSSWRLCFCRSRKRRWRWMSWLNEQCGCGTFPGSTEPSSIGPVQCGALSPWWQWPDSICTQTQKCNKKDKWLTLIKKKKKYTCRMKDEIGSNKNATSKYIIHVWT